MEAHLKEKCQKNIGSLVQEFTRMTLTLLQYEAPKPGLFSGLAKTFNDVAMMTKLAGPALSAHNLSNELARDLHVPINTSLKPASILQQVVHAGQSGNLQQLEELARIMDAAEGEGLDVGDLRLCHQELYGLGKRVSENPQANVFVIAREYIEETLKNDPQVQRLLNAAA